MSLQNILTFINQTWINNSQINNYTLYAYEAPDDVCHIICTYSNILSNQWNTTCNNGDNYTAQINIFATEEQFSNAIILRDKIKLAYNKIKDSNYNILMCDSYSGSIIKDVENKGWHIIVNLELMIQN
jgi:hypothetical protein